MECDDFWVDKESFPAGENEADSGFEMINHSSFDNAAANNGNGFDMNNGNFTLKYEPNERLIR